MRNNVGASPTCGGTGLDSTKLQFRLPVTLNGEPGHYQTVGHDSSVTHANTKVSQRKGYQGRPGHTMLEWTCKNSSALFADDPGKGVLDWCKTVGTRQ